MISAAIRDLFIFALNTGLYNVFSYYSNPFGYKQFNGTFLALAYILLCLASLLTTHLIRTYDNALVRFVAEARRTLSILYGAFLFSTLFYCR